eukprot:14849544-Alexandrium_andersonii.AAC.1
MRSHSLRGARRQIRARKAHADARAASCHGPQRRAACNARTQGRTDARASSGTRARRHISAGEGADANIEGQADTDRDTDTY